MAAPFQAYGAGVPQSAYGVGQVYPGQSYPGTHPYAQQAAQQYPGQVGSAAYGQQGAQAQTYGGQPGSQTYPGSAAPGQPQYAASGQPYGASGAQPQAYAQGYQGFGVDPQVQQWFLAVDRDRSGKITAAELEQAMKNSPQQFSYQTCQLMIGMFDRDRSGTIDMNEFQALWGFIHQWRAAFEHYDKSRSGVLEQDELNLVFTELGFRLSTNFLTTLITKFDKNKRGLNLDQFLTACILVRSLTDIFRQRDTARSGSIQLSYEEFLSVAIAYKM